MLAAPETLSAPPLVEPALLVEWPPVAGRDAVLRRAVRHLHRCGRLSDPAEVGADLAAREARGATAVNDGYALPHCRSAGVRFNSILIARLGHPVDWMAPDGQPVRFVVLLALRRENDELDHLKVIARLCRLLMRPAFRAALARTAAPADLCAEILAEIGPPRAPGAFFA